MFACECLLQKEMCESVNYFLRGNMTPLHQSRSSGLSIQSTTWMTPFEAGMSARYSGDTFTSTRRPREKVVIVSFESPPSRLTHASIDTHARLQVLSFEHRRQELSILQVLTVERTTRHVVFKEFCVFVCKTMSAV